MKDKYDLEDGEAWDFVTTCAVTFFALVQEPRVAAKDAMIVDSPTDRCALILWGAPQAQRVQQEIRDVQFRHHPCLASVVNLHLFEHQVPTKDFEQVSKEVTSLTKTAKELQVSLSTLQNKVNNKK